MAEQNRRRSPRIPCNIRPSRASRLSTDRIESLKVVILNLSREGALVATGDAIAPGETVELVFRLPNQEEDVTVQLDLRWAQHEEEQNEHVWLAGGAFQQAISLTGGEAALHTTTARQR